MPQQSDGLAKSLRDEPDRLCQIAIVTNHYGHIEQAVEGIHQEMSCKVHIRTFFFGFDDTPCLILPRIPCGSVWHVNLVSQKMAKM